MIPKCEGNFVKIKQIIFRWKKYKGLDLRNKDYLILLIKQPYKNVGSPYNRCGSPVSCLNFE